VAKPRAELDRKAKQDGPVHNRSRRKQVLFYTIFLSLLVGTIELLSLAVYRFSFHEAFSYTDVQATRRALLVPANDGDQKSQLRTWIIHPYYGFVANPTIAKSTEFGFSMPINKFGFFGQEDQIQKTHSGKITVAVIGGSVAASFGFHAADALRSALKKIPAYQEKEIVILDLGNGAFKEPQGVIIVNDIISRGGHIDLLIALDGFNEIALPEAQGNVKSPISPFYPSLWPALVDTHLSRGQMNYLGRAGLAKDARLWLASLFARPVLRYSITANLIWRVVDNRLVNTEANYRRLAQEVPPSDPESRLTNDGRAFMGPAVEYGTRRDLYKDIALHWGRSSILLNNIMIDQGGLFMQFLQPNQYVVGSKPMGEREKNIAFSTETPYRRAVESGYPYLQVVGQRLSSAGVWFEDLTNIFSQTTQEVYNDNCCHFNHRGEEFLAFAIGEAIAKRLSNPVGDGRKAVDIDKVVLDDLMFSATELAKFSANLPNYRDGSEEPLSRVKPIGLLRN
jgi:hypothetical protein